MLKRSQKSDRFLRDILIFSAAISIIFLYRYLSAIFSYGFSFATDFLVYYQAIADIVSNHSPYTNELTRNVLDGASVSYNPYLYPPFFLFFLWPFQIVSYDTSLRLWYIFQIILWLALLFHPRVKALWPRLSEKSSGHYAGIVFFISLPFLIPAIFNGQTGILSGALILFAYVLMHSHPKSASFLFAFAAFKPQLLLLSGIFLLLKKQYTIIGFAILSYVALVLLSIFVWGVELWYDYLDALLLHSKILQDFSLFHTMLKQMISGYGAFVMLSVPEVSAFYLQIIVSLSIIVGLCLLRRLPINNIHVWLYIWSATFLLTPYSYLYDMVILAPLVLIWLNQNLEQTLSILHKVISLLIVSACAVILPLHTHHIPVGIVMVALMTWVCFKDATHALQELQKNNRESHGKT